MEYKYNGKWNDKPRFEEKEVKGLRRFWYNIQFFIGHFNAIDITKVTDNGSGTHHFRATLNLNRNGKKVSECERLPFITGTPDIVRAFKPEDVTK